MASPGSITGCNATEWVVSTHHVISRIKIKSILWESKGNCRVFQHSTTVTFSNLIVPTSLLF